MSARWYRGALLALLAAFVALYARTAGYDHVWDDASLIESSMFERPWLAGLQASMRDVVDVTASALPPPELARGSYRPLLYLSHRIDRELFGTEAAGHHVHNVVLGLLALAMVLALARRWLQHDAKALIVAGVFALHPLQVECIAHVSRRGDLLAALFAAASLWLALRGTERGARRWAWVLGSTLALMLSTMSKETYIAAPIALLLIGWSMGKPRLHLVDVMAHAAGLALCLAVRISLAPAGAQDIAPGLLILPGLWLQYFSIVISPSDLSIVRPLSTLWSIPGWLALLALLASAVRTRRRELDGNALLARQAHAAALIALVLIGPSAIVVEITDVVSDRHALLPLVGYAVALVSAAHWAVALAPAAMRPLRMLGATLAAACLIVTVFQVPVWRDSKSLYMNAYMMEPDSSAAVYGLGLAHARAGDWSFAYPLFERAVQLEPMGSRAWNTLAAGALEQGDYVAAIYAAEHAVAVTDEPFRALYNLGAAHLRLGQAREGCAALARALEVNASYQSARELMTRSCAVPVR